MHQLEERRFSFSVKADSAMFANVGGGSHNTCLVPTYAALRGICETLYHPWIINWVIDRVRIMNPIVIDKNPPAVLRNVWYQVEAHMEWSNDPEASDNHKFDVGKHWALATRAFKKANERDVFVGQKDPKYKGEISVCVFGEGTSVYDTLPEVRFGRLLHSVSYPKPDVPFKTRHYCYYVMKNSVITFCRPEDCPEHRDSLYLPSIS